MASSDALLQIIGWDRLATNLQAIADYFSSGTAQQVSHDELLRLAEDMAEAARSYAPEKTGFLKSGIHVVDLGEDGVELRSAAPYSLFVEFGTIKMAAQPFLRRAYEEYGVMAGLAEKHRGEISNLLGGGS